MLGYRCLTIRISFQRVSQSCDGATTDFSPASCLHSCKFAHTWSELRMPSDYKQIVETTGKEEVLVKFPVPNAPPILMSLRALYPTRMTVLMMRFFHISQGDICKYWLQHKGATLVSIISIDSSDTRYANQANACVGRIATFSIRIWRSLANWPRRRCASHRVRPGACVPSPTCRPS